MTDIEQLTKNLETALVAWMVGLVQQAREDAQWEAETRESIRDEAS